MLQLTTTKWFSTTLHTLSTFCTALASFGTKSTTQSTLTNWTCSFCSLARFATILTISALGTLTLLNQAIRSLQQFLDSLWWKIIICTWQINWLTSTICSMLWLLLSSPDQRKLWLSLSFQQIWASTLRSLKTSSKKLVSLTLKNKKIRICSLELSFTLLTFPIHPFHSSTSNAGDCESSRSLTICTTRRKLF